MSTNLSCYLVDGDVFSADSTFYVVDHSCWSVRQGICIGVMLLGLDLPNISFGAHGLSAIGHGVTVTL
jgi:hypothetical protein